MTNGAIGAFGVAALFALTDWVAVAQQRQRLEYVAKPATIVGLIVVALLIDPEVEARRVAVVVALALSLAGDVFLMLRHSQEGGDGVAFIQKGYFVHGLAAFLLAHIAYIVAFQIDGGPAWLVLVLFVGIRLATLPITGRLTKALRASGDEALAGPVRAYAIAISGMAASVAATGEVLAIVGATLFVVSDLSIAWSRFVMPLTWAPLGIIVTYHLAQAGLVLSLVDSV